MLYLMGHGSFESPAVLHFGSQASYASVERRPLLHQVPPVSAAQPAFRGKLTTISTNSFPQGQTVQPLGLQVDLREASKVPLDAPLDRLIRVPPAQLPPLPDCPRRQVEKVACVLPCKLLVWPAGGDSFQAAPCSRPGRGGRCLPLLGRHGSQKGCMPLAGGLEAKTATGACDHPWQHDMVWVATLHNVCWRM
jgi:hypothetical protein